jgi:hypothetical protein
VLVRYYKRIKKLRTSQYNTSTMYHYLLHYLLFRLFMIDDRQCQDPDTLKLNTALLALLQPGPILNFHFEWEDSGLRGQGTLVLLVLFANKNNRFT